MIQIGLVAIGIGTILATSELAFTVVKLAGAAYLVLLGVRAVLGRGHSQPEPSRTGADGARSSSMLRQGFLVGATNPKTAVFSAAVLPQFVRDGSLPPVLQLVVLGVELVVIGAVSDVVWILAAGALRTRLARSPGRRRGIEVVGGVLMIAVGIVLAVAPRGT